MDKNTHRILGNLLQIVQRNIASVENYEIDSLLLYQVNRLDLDAKNIFWHDISMSYLRNSDNKYLKYLNKIEENADSAYAKRQHILGHNYLLSGELNKAHEYLSKVNDIDRNIYLNALIDLALVEEKLGNNDEAIEIYKKVIQLSSVSDSEYAKAQQNLANIYINKQHYTQAQKCLERIPETDSAYYAEAQFGLGLIYSLRGKDSEALDFYKKVNKKYSRIYSKAKFNEGNLHLMLPNNDLAKKSYEEVLVDEIDLYARAQFQLGDIFIKEKNIEEASIRWKNIPKNTDIYRKYGYQIQNTIEVERIVKSKSEFLNIINLVQLILDSLHIKSKYESFIAHYTNLTVSKILISMDGKEVAPLRLNTINLMNDPEEGLLLKKLLGILKITPTNELAFISCFTLHHDSLNQFRLYAKEQQQEARGVSFIFSKAFFSQQSNILDMINKLESKESNISEYSQEQENKKDVHVNKLSKAPLFRCIYLDPTSGLIKVAQREEWSFHREYKARNKTHMLDKNPETEKNWQDYQAEILQIEAQVTMYLKELVEQAKLLNPKDFNDEEKELLAEILLPLRYLIKHMAFKEEQECRMIYVTQMDNPLIKYDEKINRIYIDYEPSVMEYLEKIYLAPKAKGEKMVFEYLCSRGQAVRKDKAPVQVKISQNPFQ